MRRFAADGAELLLAITNDAWYGRTGAPYQFLAITALLAPLGVRITRLARGLPTGGQIEYASKTILSDAINERREV